MRFHPDETATAIQDSFTSVLSAALSRQADPYATPEESPPDRAVWDAAMEFGLAGIMVSEEAGGAGRGLLEAALLAEVAGRLAAPGLLGFQMLSAWALSRAPVSATVSRALSSVLSGAAPATLALGGEWVPESWDIDLAQDAVNGEVRFVQGACQAGLFLVGIRGGGLVLVEAGPGVEVTANPSSDPGRPTGRVRFNGSPAHILFPPGAEGACELFDAALVLLAADALGGCLSCLEQCVDYAQLREQFGQPIGRFQAVKHLLAGMALETEPSRALVWYAAHAADAGLPDRRRAAALAKAHLSDRYVSVCRNAIAAHGGIGYTWQSALNARFRRSVFDRAMFGAPALHRARAATLAGW